MRNDKTSSRVKFSSLLQLVPSLNHHHFDDSEDIAQELIAAIEYYR